MSLFETLPKPEKNIFVYALCEPGTENIRYIGIATTGFKRMRDHYSNGGKWTNRKKWIKELKEQNKIFNVLYLEYFNEDSSLVDDAEIFYINYLRFLGFKLLNHTEGGRTNFKFINKKVPVYTETQRHQMNSNRKRTWNTPELKKQASKIVTAQFGVKIQDDLGNNYESIAECARVLGVKRPNIGRALKYGFKCQGRILTRISGGRGNFRSIPKPPRKKRKDSGYKTIYIKDSNGHIYSNYGEVIDALKINLRQVHRLLSKECKATKNGISLERAA